MIDGLIADLDKLRLLPVPQNDTKNNVPFLALNNGVYLALNTGGQEHYFYVDYITGGIANYAPFMSSLPSYIGRFEDTEKLKSIIGSFSSNIRVESRGRLPGTLEQAVSAAILSRITVGMAPLPLVLVNMPFSKMNAP